MRPNAEAFSDRHQAGIGATEWKLGDFGVSGAIQGSQAFHDATELLGPDGRVGHWLSYSLVLAPLLYLLFARVSKAGARPPRPVLS